VNIRECQHGLHCILVETDTGMAHAIATGHDQFIDVHAAFFVTPQCTYGVGNAAVVQLDNCQSTVFTLLRGQLVQGHWLGGHLNLHRPHFHGLAVDSSRILGIRCKVFAIQTQAFGVLFSQCTVPHAPGGVRVVFDDLDPTRILRLFGRRFGGLVIPTKKPAQHVKPS
jgi:hypothetical protein